MKAASGGLTSVSLTARRDLEQVALFRSGGFQLSSVLHIVLKELEQYDIYFLETPLPIDDLDGYAYLADHSPIRIAAGEWQNTRFEFIDLMDRGHVDVVQPDVGRVGGLTEALRVAELAGTRGKTVVPHCWKTGIGIAASAQLAAATSHCAFIEYLPPGMSDSVLRDNLADDGLTMIDGQLELPSRPGLGVTLNDDALREYAIHEFADGVKIEA